MKVIAINGSPRKGGNTELLLKTVLEPLEAAGWSTELLQIGGKSIHGCRACGKCFELRNKRCAFDKDTLNEVLEKMITADAILLGSPTYFTDVSAEMKALIDRAGVVCLANGCLLAGKVGAAVVAVRRGGGTHVLDTMNHLFLIQQMVVPGSTYWNLGYGMEPGQAAGDAEGLRNMRQLGRAIAWLGTAIEKAGPYPALPYGVA
ncbi:MAG: flavodoxin family protein [Humidesulfovibrio sp.]|uniref:flavodoxin family protein n=1 Tax=Humidesulfovibrio sp. TaxID=2910988 RepID=UPI0027F7C143|nr:flavodoxin family protein [Humidesulfovibrio sp.]MDQ7835755.1 flavodoxin family protein [Humidesulfovibrio sp.]